MTDENNKEDAKGGALLVHRYVDGDLSPAERAELERRAKEEPSLAAGAAGLLELRALVTEATTAASLAEGELDSDALFSRIEAQLEVQLDAAPEEKRAPAEERKRPDLRVLQGGGEGAPRPVPLAPPDVRRRRVIGAVIGALAVAAAAAIAITQAGSGDPEVAIEDPVEGPEVLDESPEIAVAPEEAPTRTEVLEVDFGTNVGTIFAVEGDEGQRYAVVWLDDEGNVSVSD
jgi:anti-sigma factor RsiW